MATSGTASSRGRERSLVPRARAGYGSPMARLLHVLGAMALSLASGGCSFLFADGPPARHEKMIYFDCTSTPGLEVADGVLGASFALTGITALGMSESEFEDENNGGDRNAFAATNLVLTGVFVGSAI